MGLKTHLPRRDHETRATLAKLWWNLGGTFRRTFWRPKTDLLQTFTVAEDPKLIAVGEKTCDVLHFDLNWFESLFTTPRYQ